MGDVKVYIVKGTIEITNDFEIEVAADSEEGAQMIADMHVSDVQVQDTLGALELSGETRQITFDSSTEI